MKRALLLAAAALTACGGGSQTLTADEARNAMPSAAQAQVGTPGASATAQAGSANALTAAATGNVTAEYAADTLGLATSVNAGVAWPLRALSDLVNAVPPTTCAGDTCTWGPGSGAMDLNDWQLTVTKKDANDYAWSLQGKSKADPAAKWIALVTGEAFTTGVRYVGHGTMLVDLDAAAGLSRPTTEPPPATGKISCTYDNTSGHEVSAQFLGTQDQSDPTQKVNAAYRFAASATGGDLQIATRNLSTLAQLQLHSRWDGTGAGRADASFAQGGDAFTRSQCWDAASTQFNLVYQVTGPVPAANDMGSEAACVFAPAALPTITAP